MHERRGSMCKKRKKPVKISGNGLKRYMNTIGLTPGIIIRRLRAIYLLDIHAFACL